MKTKILANFQICISVSLIIRDMHNNIGTQYQQRCVHFWYTSQPAFTCSKLTIETLEQGVKYVQS